MTWHQVGVRPSLWLWLYCSRNKLCKMHMGRVMELQLSCYLVIGIDHDTVCAGVVGTAIRHSTSCAGRLVASKQGGREVANPLLHLFLSGSHSHCNNPLCCAYGSPLSWVAGQLQLVDPVNHCRLIKLCLIAHIKPLKLYPQRSVMGNISDRNSQLHFVRILISISNEKIVVLINVCSTCCRTFVVFLVTAGGLMPNDACYYTHTQLQWDHVSPSWRQRTLITSDFLWGVRCHCWPADSLHRVSVISKVFSTLWYHHAFFPQTLPRYSQSLALSWVMWCLRGKPLTIFVS